MATVNSREIVDRIIEGKGWYGEGDPQVVKIVEYQNMFNGDTAYGLVYIGEELDRYETSPAVVNPRTIWQA